MIRLSTGSQCSSLRIGVARAYFGLHETSVMYSALNHLVDSRAIDLFSVII